MREKSFSDREDVFVVFVNGDRKVDLRKCMVITDCDADDETVAVWNFEIPLEDNRSEHGKEHVYSASDWQTAINKAILVAEDLGLELSDAVVLANHIDSEVRYEHLFSD